MGFFPLSGEATKGEKDKFPRESRKVHYIFPMNGLAGIVKMNFPMSGDPFVALPLKGKNPIPISPQHGIDTLLRVRASVLRVILF